jgi:hypothetical protein
MTTAHDRTASRRRRIARAEALLAEHRQLSLREAVAFSICGPTCVCKKNLSKRACEQPMGTAQHIIDLVRNWHEPNAKVS